jgi:hypothetical protein
MTPSIITRLSRRQHNNIRAGYCRRSEALSEDVDQLFRNIVGVWQAAKSRRDYETLLDLSFAGRQIFKALKQEEATEACLGTLRIAVSNLWKDSGPQERRESINLNKMNAPFAAAGRQMCGWGLAQRFSYAMNASRRLARYLPKKKLSRAGSATSRDYADGLDDCPDRHLTCSPTTELSELR